MAGKPSEGWVVDKDQEGLDNSIALLLDIQHRADLIIETSDDPAIVQWAVDIARAARSSQELHKVARYRLVELRRLAKLNGEAGRE